MRGARVFESVIKLQKIFMYRKHLVNHIVMRMAEGAPEKEIRAELAKDGWTENDIKDALAYAMRPDRLKKFSIIRLLDYEIPVYVSIITTLSALIFLALMSGWFRMENFSSGLAISAEERHIFSK